MKRCFILFFSLFFTSSIFSNASSNEIIYVDNNNEVIKKVDLSTGIIEDLYDYSQETDNIETPWITGTNVRATNLNVHFVDNETGKVYLKNDGDNQFFIYDVINDTFSQSISLGNTDNSDDFFFPLPTIATKPQLNILNDKTSGSVALSSALSTLPSSSPNAFYTCGLGTGIHDSSSALSAGCASDFSNYEFVDNMPKIFQTASFNIGSSFLINGEPDISEARDMSIKAGITFKFGSIKPTRVADKQNYILENKIDTVMQENRTLKAQLKEENDLMREENNLLKAQIAEINTQLKALNMLAMN